MATKTELYYVDSAGEEVPAGSPDVAYQINPTAQNSDAFVQDLKDKAAGKAAQSKPLSAGSAAPKADAKAETAKAKADA